MQRRLGGSFLRCSWHCLGARLSDWGWDWDLVRWRHPAFNNKATRVWGYYCQLNWVCYRDNVLGTSYITLEGESTTDARTTVDCAKLMNPSSTEDLGWQVAGGDWQCWDCLRYPAKICQLAKSTTQQLGFVLILQSTYQHTMSKLVTSFLGCTKHVIPIFCISWPYGHMGPC